jgi:hypothetical protein
LRTANLTVRVDESRLTPSRGLSPAALTIGYTLADGWPRAMGGTVI